MKCYTNIESLLANDRDGDVSVNSVLPQTKQQRLPAAKRRRRNRKHLRVVPLVSLGLIICALIIAVGCLIWSIIAFFSQTDVTLSIGEPLIIFFIAVLLSSAFITLLIRGRNVFPSVAMATIAFVANLIITANVGTEINIASALLKLLIILLAATIGFTIGKLLSILLFR